MYVFMQQMNNQIMQLHFGSQISTCTGLVTDSHSASYYVNSDLFRCLLGTVFWFEL